MTKPGKQINFPSIFHKSAAVFISKAASKQEREREREMLLQHLVRKGKMCIQSVADGH